MQVIAAKHSPAPWAVRDGLVVDAANELVVDLVREGDLPLIAAAPDLLNVALRCERQLTAEGWVTSGPRHALDPEAVLLLDLRAAITKAAGAVS